MIFCFDRQVSFFVFSSNKNCFGLKSSSIQGWLDSKLIFLEYQVHCKIINRRNREVNGGISYEAGCCLSGRGWLVGS